VGPQAAEVLVDGVSAGIWYDADENYSAVDKRWVDSDFLISSNLLSGKTSVQITISPLASFRSWNTYRYWADCIKPYVLSENIDADGLPDEWEREYASGTEILDGSVDSDGDTFNDFEEYIAGTDPLVPLAFPAIQYSPDGACVIFQSVLGRMYQLQYCNSLMSNEWDAVWCDIPGSGGQISIPGEPDENPVYYRLLVKKP
jgi:hypothetical protein